MKTVNERIEAIERELFIMEFKEHWDAKDWARRDELNRELAQLRGWALFSFAGAGAQIMIHTAQWIKFRRDSVQKKGHIFSQNPLTD